MSTPSTEIVGLLVGKCGPVTSSYVPTPKGVSVLYGLNGAGKTHLLQALTANLTGHPARRTSTSLVVRVGEASSSWELPRWLNQYLSNWADHDEKEWGGGRDDLGSIELSIEPAVAHRRAVLEALEAGCEPDEAGQDSFDRAGVTRPAVAEEIISQGMYILDEPSTGVTRSIRVGAQPTDNTPRLNLALPSDINQREGPDAFFDPTWREFVHLGSTDNSVWPVIASLYFSLHTVQSEPIADVIVADGEVPSVSEVLRALSPLAGPLISQQDQSALSQKTIGILQDISSHARELLGLVLLDAPYVEMSIGSPLSWLLHEKPTWGVASHSRSDGLRHLSEAEMRWVSLSISTAVRVALRNLTAAHAKPQGPWSRQPEAPGPLFIIVDEPEAHLHRSAEAHMAEGLARWADLLDAHIVVGSHSPELLDHPTSKLLHVAKDRETTRSSVCALNSPTVQTMSDFGLHASDLLRRQRGFLLVEGLHDQIVLEELVGDDLRAARVEILPIRGARQLPATVDSQFLFDFTDATVIVMLDAMNVGELTLAWDRAQEVAADGDVDAAGVALREAMPGNAAETRWMRDFLSKSLARGVNDRLIPFGLEAPDVIDYLPVAGLVPIVESWSGLREMHRISGSRKDFKTWLAAAHGADFSAAAVRRAASSMDRVPDELVELVNICLRLGR